MEEKKLPERGGEIGKMPLTVCAAANDYRSLQKNYFPQGIYLIRIYPVDIFSSLILALAFRKFFAGSVLLINSKESV
ncbi:MAG: hypothetical protein HUU32_13825 [Calditrichaceae bacterium]|nr:hypothetical protein [Calditrichia bacterium]NUQ42465.1 hypothetical protein [Calditrichaceae bacterium]